MEAPANESTPPVDAAIIVPCYNEADRIPGGRFVEFAEEHPRVQFVFVNDGSKDSTLDTLKDFTRRLPDQLKIVSYDQNQGKAEAIRRGMQAIFAQYPSRFVGYWDADLATPLEEIEVFLNAAESRQGIRFLSGCRVNRMGATINRHLLRHYMGRVVATMASLTLRMPYFDTQCGAKLIERELAEGLFNEPFISRWLFDVELILRIVGALGYATATRSILEMPLSTWEDVGDSKVRVTYLPRIPIEFLRIRNHYRHVFKSS